MTNREAIKILSQHSEHWKRLSIDNICSKEEGLQTVEAFDMAINALTTIENIKQEIEQVGACYKEEGNKEKADAFLEVLNIIDKCLHKGEE